MAKTVVYEVDAMFGDCDPAGIVFFPNFSKWMDASSLNFFVQCGVPPWRELVKATGIIGTPLLEIHTKFMRPATYGERLQIHTSVAEWRAKALIDKHLVMRGDELLCEGSETRVFCIRDPANPERIQAIPIPPDIKTLCTQVPPARPAFSSRSHHHRKRHVISNIRRQFVQTSAATTLLGSLVVSGLLPIGRTPDDMAKSMQHDFDFWGPIVKRIDFTAES